MMKLNTNKIDWLKYMLTSGEASTREELVELFMTTGKLNQAEAEKWASLRSFYHNQTPLRVGEIGSNSVCVHCGSPQLAVVLNLYTWLLECADCGNVLSDKERLCYATAPLRLVVMTDGSPRRFFDYPPLRRP